jgi:stage V sporulation protein D (sporulation-specific penicillin-binding protein)
MNASVEGASIRLKVLSLGILLFALILASKLFLVQVVHSDTYSSRADRQYATPAGNIFERGSIFFTKKGGDVISAATQATGYKVTIDPTKIIDPKKTCGDLKQTIVIDCAEFTEKAQKEGDTYEEVAHRLTREEADEIRDKKIPGVSLFQEKWRFYPGEELASHALGFVGWNGDVQDGRYGLERQYEGNLGRGGEEPYVNFFAEVFGNLGDTLFESDEEAGNIITTIEPTVQETLEKKLEEVKSRYYTQMVGGIVMDPHTGEIYALSAKPDFDPNNFSKVTNAKVFSNPLVENVYEFGSVVKPLVMAAGIDAGVVSASTKYEDKGSVVVENKIISNFDKKARGVVDMQEVLGQSLNTGMVYVYNKLGKSRMRDYMFSYGIKDKTGIDLPNESGSLVSNLNSPRDLEYANAAFGQGIALTPMQMIRALASLSNGGKLVVPHVVKSIKFDSGLTHDIEYETVPVKISPATAEEVTRMLVRIMDKSLVTTGAKLEHYSVAVKTGTAQVAKKDGGGYYEDKNIHSFFGYFPAHDPKFIVFLFAIDPRGVDFASQTWADPFLSITKFLLNYYEVPPDR